MKAIWAWIVKAAQDVWSTIWSILSVLRDKTGKFSFKRMSAAVALWLGIDFLFRGGVIEGLILLGYVGVVAIVAAFTGT